MHRHAQEGIAEGEQIVDADGLVALETVHRRLGVQFALQPLKAGVERIDQFRRNCVLNDGEAVALYPCNMVAPRLVIHLCTAAIG